MILPKDEEITIGDILRSRHILDRAEALLGEEECDEECVPGKKYKSDVFELPLPEVRPEHFSGEDEDVPEDSLLTRAVKKILES